MDFSAVMESGCVLGELPLFATAGIPLVGCIITICCLHVCTVGQWAMPGPHWQSGGANPASLPRESGALQPTAWKQPLAVFQRVPQHLYMGVASAWST